MAMPTMKTVKQMVTEKLYIPRSPVVVDMMMTDGATGQGYDVLSAARGMPGFSPVCEVVTYDAKMPMPSEMLPKETAMIEAMFGPIQPATPHYVYCLQVR